MKKRTLDDDIEMVFTYLERIKYILDIDDYLHIRKVFGNLIVRGFIIKKKR